MTFVDTNVFMYAGGQTHPRRSHAGTFFDEARRDGRPLVTSAQVVQKLMHVYVRMRRPHTL